MKAYILAGAIAIALTGAFITVSFLPMTAQSAPRPDN
jgi:hypothetical protein